MQIVSLSFGRFQELSDLDIFFRHSFLRLKLVLDIYVPEDKGFDFENIHKKVLDFFPNLQKHKCWANILGGSVSNRGRKDLPFQRVGGITDLAHLIEHMIIGLQATVGLMESCSGLTCGYQDPANRFDLFIECKDRRVATFSSNLAVKMMKELLWDKNLYFEYSKLIQLTKCLYSEPELIFSLQKLSQKLGWQKEELAMQIRELISLKFLNKEFLLSNSVKRRGKK
ncbi:MAG: hypothetical protein V1890_06675 [Candidatus Zixiibacteriota bacterium]